MIIVQEVQHLVHHKDVQVESQNFSVDMEIVYRSRQK